jgi:hypothetical protein
MKPTHIKQLQSNAHNLKVVALGPGKLAVESTSDPLNSHIVQVAFLPNGDVRTACTCEWSQFRGVGCSHTLAALDYLAAHKGRKLSFWADEAAARRQKRRTFRLAHMRSPRDDLWITSRNAEPDA